MWHKLADKPWGMREFAVATPDGHRIVSGATLPNFRDGAVGADRPADGHNFLP